MFFLIMLIAVFTGQFAHGVFACFCLLVACIMADVLLFFVWATFLVSMIQGILGLG